MNIKRTLVVSIMITAVVAVVMAGCKGEPEKPEELSYTSCVFELQITTNPFGEIVNILKGPYGHGPSRIFDDNPDVYFLLRIDKVQDPILVPIVHTDGQNRPIHQSFIFNRELIGRRVIVEVWDSDGNDAAFNTLKAIINGSQLGVRYVQNGVSVNYELKGSRVADMLKGVNPDDYLCQFSIVVGTDEANLKVNTTGGETINLKVNTTGGETISKISGSVRF